MLFPKNCFIYTSINEGVSWIKWPALHAEEVEIFLTRQIPYSIHLCCAPMHHDWELTPWIKGMNQWKKFKLASNEDLSGHFEQIRHFLISYIRDNDKFENKIFI